jgi:hypothetical protein
MSRDIDALVAEHVMGWTNNWDNPGRGGMWGIMDWIEKDDGTRTPVRAADFPSYSGDIESSWEVVEKLANDGYQVTVSVYKDGCHVDCGIPRPGTWEPKRSFAKTVPMAICLAALRAKGVEFPDP